MDDALKQDIFQYSARVLAEYRFVFNDLELLYVSSLLSKEKENFQRDGKIDPFYFSPEREESL